MVGGGGGCGCMLLLHPIPTFAPCVLTFTPYILTFGPCACGVSLLSNGANIPLAHVVASPSATCAARVPLSQEDAFESIR